MPTLHLPHCELYYEADAASSDVAVAPTSAPAIVFAHGAGGNHLSWWQQVPAFRAGYRCVVFDHRGFGQSEEAEGGPGPAAFVDDLEALLDHLAIERAALVGQSMGGWSCLGLALRAPQRVAALVMADTLGGVRNTTIDAASQAGRERMAAEGLATMAYSPRLEQERPAMAFLYREIMALNQPLGPWLRDGLSASASSPEALIQLQPPTLWVVGEEDPITPPAAIREGHRLTPGSAYFEAAETGHSVYFERAPAFNARVQEFFSAAGWAPGA